MATGLENLLSSGTTVKIVLLEPYFTGSHKQWAEGLQAHSKHDITLLTLEGRFWKWRMHGGAVSLAKQFHDLHDTPDLILATDMLDVTTFLSLTRERTHSIPVITYFHENQLSYPWSPTDRDVVEKRDHHYGFINYSSAMSSNKICFNSQFHMNSFFSELKKYLGQFPDYRLSETIPEMQHRSEVLPLGLSLERFEPFRLTPDNPAPVILWNHRWEYDKNPDTFFNTLFLLDREGVDFKLIVIGEKFNHSPDIFSSVSSVLKDKITHLGYTSSFKEYAEFLWKADVLPITSHQDFFGVSIMEAIYCDCLPILPNRLTYPELFKNKWTSAWFYDNDESFYHLLKNAIESKTKLIPNLGEKLYKKYDWKIVVDDYDNLFEAVLTQ